MTIAIWWCRRDLRLMDNTALMAACAAADHVVPLYILDPALMNSPRTQGPRIPWLLEGLARLRDNIEAIGGQLVIRVGHPIEVLPRFAHEIGAAAVHFNRDYGPYSTRRDSAVITALEAAGVSVKSYKDLVIHEAHEVRSRTNTTFSIYSPYRRAWGALPKPECLPAPTSLHSPAHLPSDPLPATMMAQVPSPVSEPGEAAALARLDLFMHSAISGYSEARNHPGLDGTSILSPYLRWGMLSPRQCYHAAQTALLAAATPEARRGAEQWINELVWREFFYQVLAVHPHVTRGAFRPAFDRIRWQNDPRALEAWKAGQTGYPIVDAGMRQLRETGWMHNRLRMIVASFLCKDLLIDWREGESYFMRSLLDGDVAANNGGWQWTAGTGTDAAPYFRIFNPVTQGITFDVEGTYIRRWVPELRNVSAKYIHEPWQMPLSVQQDAGVLIGQDYPLPIVEHNERRKRALELYSSVRA